MSKLPKEVGLPVARPNKLARLEKQAAIISMSLGFLGFVSLLIWIIFFSVSWREITVLLLMYIVTELGLTVGFHRLFTHVSFKTGKGLQKLLGVAGSMAVQGPLSFWVAYHRMHHRYSDKSNDPHSPHLFGGSVAGGIRGFYHAHMGWLFDHQLEQRKRYTRDLRNNPVVREIDKGYFQWIVLGLLIPSMLGFMLTLTWQGLVSGFIWGGLGRIFLVHHVTWSVNSVCHVFGSRPFATLDKSTNNLIVGILALGEGWHNNHHAFPRSARHGLLWWQLDFSYIVIWLLEKLGLVWSVRRPNYKQPLN